MTLFTDVISGDEMFSDAFPIKVVDDIVYEVDCALIKVDREHDISTEEEEEDNTILVNNLVHSFNLTRTSLDKKTYMLYLKGYMKKILKHVKETNPDRAEAFEQGAAQYAKKIIANFKDLEHYVGASVDPDAMVAILNYREDGVTPYFTFWKDGLRTKV
ncbi:Translationally controlled tumor protein [Aspergillus parasiticus SU-1]|uniref:Translationally-controlled tumor protein homolog n=1 Tax=Aspergillus parasiticus (strain ATCC 56775 / NRRL 5862 / SRRC 143 / SU-1) TaxID=1403190 RepID=A0A0F0IH27_ASPPU|nr:Translationally controlled tumor protein [Aspergillus parasiticus SU-1]